VTDAAGAIPTVTPQQIAVIVVRRQVRLLGLLGLIFFTVSGGAYGLEDMVSLSGPGMAIVLLLVTPVIWSVPAALMVAELGTAMPVEGGYYQWTKAGLGKFWGYQQGFWSWETTWVDMAIYPVLFADFLSLTYLPEAAAGEVVFFTLGPLVVDLHWVIAFSVILVFTLVNLRGAKIVGDSSLTFMIIVLAPFAVMVAIGIPKLFIDGINPFEPFTAPGESVAAAAGAGLWICMWNYLGWDGLSTVAGEIENPRRTFPLGLTIMIPVITLVYVLPVLAGLAGSTDWQAWTAGYFAILGGNLAGPWLEALLTFGGLISAAGLFSALLLSVTRLPFVLARDGFLPPVMTREHPRYGTPHVAIIVSSAIYAMFCFGAFADLVVVDVFVYSLALLLEFASLIALRIKRPNMNRPYKIPGGWLGISFVVLFPLLIILFAVYQTVVDEGVSALYLSLFAAALGPLTYPLASRFIKRDKTMEPVVVDGVTLWSER
jgi:amino acid transporter